MWDFDLFNNIIQLASVLAAMFAAFYSYKAVRETSRTRKLGNFLSLYEKLLELQKEYAINAHQEEEEKPRISEQLLNHYEVIASLYLSNELDQSFIDNLMKEYLIAEIKRFSNRIVDSRKIEPTAYNHIEKLFKKWNISLIKEKS